MHGIVPVDALDPTCTTRELIENKTTHLYRYGCYFEDTTVELEELVSIPRAERSSFRFHLRGFTSPFTNDFLFPICIFISPLNLSRALLGEIMAEHFIIINIVVGSSIS